MKRWTWFSVNNVEVWLKFRHSYRASSCSRVGPEPEIAEQSLFVWNFEQSQRPPARPLLTLHLPQCLINEDKTILKCKITTFFIILSSANMGPRVRQTQKRDITHRLAEGDKPVKVAGQRSQVTVQTCTTYLSDNWKTNRKGAQSVRDYHIGCLSDDAEYDTKPRESKLSTRAYRMIVLGDFVYLRKPDFHRIFWTRPSVVRRLPCDTNISWLSADLCLSTALAILFSLWSHQHIIQELGLIVWHITSTQGCFPEIWIRDLKRGMVCLRSGRFCSSRMRIQTH